MQQTSCTVSGWVSACSSVWCELVLAELLSVEAIILMRRNNTMLTKIPGHHSTVYTDGSGILMGYPDKYGALSLLLIDK